MASSNRFVECQYCHRPVAQIGLQAHYDNVCSKAPVSAKSGKPVFVPSPVIVIEQEPALEIIARDIVPEVISVPPVAELAPSVRVTSNGLIIPAVDPHFVVKQSTLTMLKRVENMSKSHHVNVMITGMQGSGKTSLARQHAAIFKRPFCEVQCGLMSEPGQWFGGMKFSPDRGTYFQESQFIRAIETENCAILLDEFNRVENPKVLNPLFPILDGRGQAYIDDIQRVIKVAKGVIFFATLNEGIIFSGIDFVDTALRDRFYVIEQHFPPPEFEIAVVVSKAGVAKDVAEKLVSLAVSSRNNPELERKISTRQVIMAAEDVKYGASIREAVEFAISNSYGEQAQVIMQALQAFLPESQARGGKTDGWTKFTI